MAGDGTSKPESSGLETNSPAGNAGTTKQGGVDLETLAAEIYRLLKQELRLERERGGRR